MPDHDVLPAPGRAPPVALAFGPGWQQAVPVPRILSLSFTIMVFGHLSLHLLSARALLGRLVGITLAAARVVLLAILMPPLGLVNAALAGALTAAGLGWSNETNVRLLAEATAAGALVHAAAILATWLLAGCRTGAETDVIALLRRLVRRPIRRSSV